MMNFIVLWHIDATNDPLVGYELEMYDDERCMFIHSSLGGKNLEIFKFQTLTVHLWTLRIDIGSVNT